MKFLFPTLLIVVAVLVFYFETMPLLDKVTALRSDSATVNLALDKARELLKVRDVKQKELDSFPQDIDARLKKLLPNQVDNVRLIIDLIALANKYGLTIRDPHIEPTAKGSLGADLHAYDSVDLSFGVSASYEVFQRFLADMERSLRMLDVTSLSFIAGEKDTYDFNVTVRTYWLK